MGIFKLPANLVLAMWEENIVLLLSSVTYIQEIGEVGGSPTLQTPSKKAKTKLIEVVRIEYNKDVEEDVEDVVKVVYDKTQVKPNVVAAIPDQIPETHNDNGNPTESPKNSENPTPKSTTKRSNPGKGRAT